MATPVVAQLMASDSYELRYQHHLTIIVERADPSVVDDLSRRIKSKISERYSILYIIQSGKQAATHFMHSLYLKFHQQLTKFP